MTITKILHISKLKRFTMGVSSMTHYTDPARLNERASGKQQVACMQHVITSKCI